MEAPYPHPTGKIALSSNVFDWDMEQSLRSYGVIAPGEPRMKKFPIRQPIGPVVAFAPWYVPMSTAATMWEFSEIRPSGGALFGRSTAAEARWKGSYKIPNATAPLPARRTEAGKPCRKSAR